MKAHLRVIRILSVSIRDGSMEIESRVVQRTDLNLEKKRKPFQNFSIKSKKVVSISYVTNFKGVVIKSASYLGELDKNLMNFEQNLVDSDKNIFFEKNKRDVKFKRELVPCLTAKFTHQPNYT